MPVIQMGQTVGDSEDQEVKNGEETQDTSSVSEPEPSEETPTIEEDTSENTVEEETTDDSEEEPIADDKITALQAEEARLREQIVALRTERRTVRQQKEEPLLVEKSDDLSDVAEADIALVEKILKAKGYVRKDEISTMSYQEKIETFKNEWLEAHPEYLPANDADDKNWNALKGTIDSMFKSPSNPSDIKKIMDVAHSIVKPTASIPIKNRATVDASKEKIETSSKGASAGGAGKAPETKPKANISRNSFHGFTEEEFKELGI